MRTQQSTIQLRFYWLATLLMFGACQPTTPDPLKTPDKLTSSDKNKAGAIRFRDYSTESGITATYRNGEESDNFSILESLGGGVACFDYDLDGQLDLFFPGGGKIVRDEVLKGLPSTLWRNGANARFTDVSLASRLPDARTYTHGCTAADVDNDGFMDVLVTGYGSLQLIRNEGDGTFSDITDVSLLVDSSWSSSSAWGDFNGDGSLDLYVAHYVDWSWQKHPKCATSVSSILDVCTPNDFLPLTDELFLSNGDGTFRKSHAESGMEPGGKGLGVLAMDINFDSHIDIYVANDTTNNFLYLNDGQAAFHDTGLASGTALDGNGSPNGSMGIATMDFDGNLLPDLWVTNYENETYALYQNNGDASFLWATERAGIGLLGRSFVGFGTVAGDFDHDGDEDMVVSNGHVMRKPANSEVAQLPVFLENVGRDGRKKFERSRFDKETYFAKPHRGRGLVCGDLDGDGDLDLVFPNLNEVAGVLLNETAARNNAFCLTLIGRQSNRNAIGARVILKTNQSRYLRLLVGGGSYLSQNPYVLHWGMADGESPVELEITWPTGRVELVDVRDAKKSDIIIESSGTP